MLEFDICNWFCRLYQNEGVRRIVRGYICQGRSLYLGLRIGGVDLLRAVIADLDTHIGDSRVGLQAEHQVPAAIGTGGCAADRRLPLASEGVPFHRQRGVGRETAQADRARQPAGAAGAIHHVLPGVILILHPQVRPVVLRVGLTHHTQH